MLLTIVLLEKAPFTPPDDLNEWKPGEHPTEPTLCSDTRNVLQIGKQNVNLYFSTRIETKSRGDLKTRREQQERLVSSPCCFDYSNKKNKPKQKKELPSAK